MFSGKNRILLIRLSSLGDILLTTPVIRSIKTSFPEIKIDFLVLNQYRDIVKYNPHLNEVYSFSKDESIKNLLADLNENNYEVVIDLQNNRRSRKFVDDLGIVTYSFNKPSLAKFLLVKMKINLLKPIKSIPERYAESIPDLKLDEQGLQLALPVKLESGIEFSENNIGFCPGSRHFTKMWPEEYFIELGNKLNEMGFRIVLMGGSSDVLVCTRITEQLADCVNLCSRDDILQIGEDMLSCRLVVCNDSGMMHTASAVGVPLVTVFGSTVKEFGFTPYRCRNLILEDNSLSCRPCSHIGRSKCPKKHFKCMKNITPEILLNKLITFSKTL